MDHLHCPLGFLREEARRAAAIELRIALEGIRLRWSRLGQTRYNQAKKTADETWRALNDHIRTCEICRHSRSGLQSAELTPEFVPTPALLLADGNPAFLELIIGMLQDTYQIAGALSSGDAVVEQAAKLQPDVIILDISLGDVNGLEVAKRLKQAGCPAKIIFLTLYEDMDFADAAFHLGASGYVFKSRISTDLKNAISVVLHGGHFSSIV